MITLSFLLIFLPLTQACLSSSVSKDDPRDDPKIGEAAELRRADSSLKLNDRFVAVSTLASRLVAATCRLVLPREVRLP